MIARFVTQWNWTELIGQFGQRQDSNQFKRADGQKSVDKIIDRDILSLRQWSSQSYQFDATDSSHNDT